MARAEKPPVPSRPLDEPRPGFFKLRQVRGGPWVGSRIEYEHPTDPETGELLTERSKLWVTTINGKLVRAPSPDPVRAGVFQVWCSGTEIKESDYRFMVADHEWATKHAPDDPVANPTEKVEIGNLPADFFKL